MTAIKKMSVLVLIGVFVLMGTVWGQEKKKPVGTIEIDQTQFGFIVGGSSGHGVLHFKGKEYEVIGVAKHTETLDDYVVYFDEERNMWVRPVEMFLQTVVRDGKVLSRFSYIGDGPKAGA